MVMEVNHNKNTKQKLGNGNQGMQMPKSALNPLRARLLMHAKPKPVSHSFVELPNLSAVDFTPAFRSSSLSCSNTSISELQINIIGNLEQQWKTMSMPR